MQRTADDQRHGDGIGVHHQDMLEPEREKLRQRQDFVDRMDRLARGGLALGLIALDWLVHENPRCLKACAARDSGMQFPRLLRGF